MDFENGRVVISKAGRDKGKKMVIVSLEDDSVFVCDGHERPLERPKRKNKKHLTLTSKTLSERDMTGNRALKKALAE